MYPRIIWINENRPMLNGIIKKNDMAQITYFFRNKKDGISIGRVFDIIEDEVRKTECTEKVYMPYGGAGLFHVMRNLWYTFCHRNNNGVNHITGAAHYLSLALPKKHTITTVHDLGMIYNNGLRLNPIKFAILYIFIVLPLYRNKMIICISDFTKRELLAHSRIKSDKIRVIPDPIDQGFFYSPKAFNNECPVVLHIGTKENKNLARTIEAFSALKVKLRIIGRLSDSQKDLLSENRVSYTNAFDLSDKEIIEEYIACDIVNMVSIYEGFGMPIIEAQSVGRACITSNIEPMNSIAGGGALIVDPYNVESIRNGYKQLIKSEELRNQLIERGLFNSESYKSQAIAKAYVNIYKELNISDEKY